MNGSTHIHEGPGEMEWAAGDRVPSEVRVEMAESMRIGSELGLCIKRERGGEERNEWKARENAIGGGFSCS